MKIIKSFFTIWTYSLSKKEEKGLELINSLGKSKAGVSEFFKGLEAVNRNQKYSFK